MIISFNVRYIYDDMFQGRTHIWSYVSREGKSLKLLRVASTSSSPIQTSLCRQAMNIFFQSCTKQVLNSLNVGLTNICSFTYIILLWKVNKKECGIHLQKHRISLIKNKDLQLFQLFDVTNYLHQTQLGQGSPLVQAATAQLGPGSQNLFQVFTFWSIEEVRIFSSRGSKSFSLGSSS